MVCLLLVGTACVTAWLATGPDSIAFIQPEDTAPEAGAGDTTYRKDEKVRVMEAESIEVKENDLVDLVSSYLIDYINQTMGLNVEQAQSEETASIKLVATKNQVDGAIILKIKALKMISIDALSDPLTVDLTLELVVFDAGGQEIYRRTVTGHLEKRISPSILEERVGELFKPVVKDALGQFGKDPDLKRVIAKFKYGVVGGAIAKIF